MSLLSFEKLGMRVAGRTLFSGLSCQLPSGIYALFGENGVGKSTLLKMLVGALEPSAGDIRINGIDLATRALEAKRELAYVPDRPMVYPGMCGEDLLELVSKVRGAAYLDDSQALVERLRLTPHLSTRFDSMSLGTQKKFFLAAGLIGLPRILILDEPTNAIDQHAEAELLQLLGEFGGRGLVLFATHDGDFANRIGARRLVLHSDRLAAE